MKNNAELRIHGVWFAILFVILAILFSLQSNLVDAIRSSIGLQALLLWPGYSLTWLIWSTGRLTSIERFVASLALSIATVPTLTFLFSKYHFSIGLSSTIVAIVVVIAAGPIGLALRPWVRRMMPTKHQS